MPLPVLTRFFSASNVRGKERSSKIKTFACFMTDRILAKRALLEGEAFDIPNSTSMEY